MNTIKSGWKTTEFWLSLAAMIFGVILASGVIESESSVYKIIGFIVSALGSLGYVGSRTMVKAAEIRRDAIVKSSEIDRDTIVQSIQKKS